MKSSQRKGCIYKIGELIIPIMDRKTEYRFRFLFAESFIGFVYAPFRQLFCGTTRVQLLNNVWYPTSTYVFSDPLKDEP